MLDTITAVNGATQAAGAWAQAHIGGLLPIPLDIPCAGAGTCAPKAPPGSFAGKVTSVIGWAKWVALGICILGIVAIGVGLAVGGEGRGGHHLGKLGYALGGVAIIAGVGSLLGFLAV